MAQKGEVRYRLTADNAQFKKAFTEAKSQAQDLGKSLSSHLGPAGDILSAIGPAGMVAAAGLGAVAAGAAVAGAALGKALDRADQIANLQAQTGLMAESLQRLGAVAMVSGSSTETLATAIGTLQKNLIEAPEGFDRLGLSAKRLVEMRPETAFAEVAKAIKAIQNPTEQSAAAMLYFGKSGGEMLRVIKSDIEGVSKRAQDLGLVLSGDTIKALDSLGDEFDLAKAAAGGVLTNLGAVIGTSPGVKEAVGSIADAFGELSKAITENKESVQDLVHLFAILAKGVSIPIKVVAAATGAVSETLALLGQIPKDMQAGWKWLKGAISLGTSSPYAAAYGAAYGAGPLAAPGTTPPPGNEAPGKPGPHFITAAELEAQKKYIEALKDAVGKFFDELAKRRNARETFDLLGDSVDDLNFKLGMLASQLDRFSKNKGLDALSNSGIAKALGDLNKGAAGGGSSPLTAGWKEMLTDLQRVRAETAGTEEQIKELGIAVLPVNHSFDATFGKVLSVKREIGNTKKATYDWGAALQNIANMVISMGGKGGLFGSILGGASGIGAVLQSFTKTGKGSLGEGFKGLKASFSGGFSGILSGLSGAFALGSAAFGIGKAIVGLFKGDPVKKAQKEVGKILGEGISRELAEQLLNEAKRTGKSLSQVAQEYKKQQEALREAERKRNVSEGLGKAVTGVNDLIAAVPWANPAIAQAAAGIFSSVFWAKVKTDGIAAAGEALGPAFDKILEEFNKLGIDTAALGPIGQLIGLSRDPRFAGASSAAAATGNVLAGMRQAGMVDQGLLDNSGVLAAELQKQAAEAAKESGKEPAEASKLGFQAVSGLLSEMLNASIASGRELSDAQKALLDEAKANGIDIVADPMLQQLQVSRESRDFLRTIAQGGGGGRGDRPDIPDSPFPAARGMGPMVAPDFGRGLGPLVQTHAGEGILVVPKHRMRGRVPRFFGARAGLVDDGGGAGGGGGTAGGGSSTSTGTTTLDPATATAIASSAAEAAVAAAPTPVQIQNAPVIQIVDKSVVRTADGQRAFGKFVVAEVQRALDQNSGGLREMFIKLAREAR